MPPFCGETASIWIISSPQKSEYVYSFRKSLKYIIPKQHFNLSKRQNPAIATSADFSAFPQGEETIHVHSEAVKTMFFSD